MVGISVNHIYTKMLCLYGIDGNLLVINPMVKRIKNHLEQNKPNNCVFLRESSFPGVHFPLWKFNSWIPNISMLQSEVPCPSPIIFTTNVRSPTWIILGPIKLWASLRPTRHGRITAYCWLLVVGCYLLFGVCCLLSVDRWLLLVSSWLLLFVTCCLLFVVRCLLIVGCLLCVLAFPLHRSKQRPAFVVCRPTAGGAGLPIWVVGLSWATWNSLVQILVWH